MSISKSKKTGIEIYDKALVKANIDFEPYFLYGNQSNINPSKAVPYSEYHGQESLFQVVFPDGWRGTPNTQKKLRIIQNRRIQLLLRRWSKENENQPDKRSL